MKQYVMIESEDAIAKIYYEGAELFSLSTKDDGREFMWQADPEHWGRHGPILFPVVGSLKNNIYSFGNKTYSMSRHGFARDMLFELEGQGPSSATFVLRDNEESLRQYPFRFRLSVHYTLTGRALNVSYTVENCGHTPMFFSIGGHPAFNVPLRPELAFEDHMMHFDLRTGREDGAIKIYPLDEDGLLREEGTDLLPGPVHSITLDKTLFRSDALIFKDLSSFSVSITSDKDDRKITLSCNDVPYLGIWSKYGADFVCIEPWWGITDTADRSGELQDKAGILSIPVGGSWQGAWQISIDRVAIKAEEQ